MGKGLFKIQWNGKKALGKTGALIQNTEARINATPFRFQCDNLQRLTKIRQIKGILKEHQCYVSQISLIEVLGYQKITSDEELYFQKFFDYCSLIAINKEIIDKSIELRRQFNLSLGDAVIAASASFLELPIITSNTSDFDKITGIELIDPLNIDS